MKFSYLFLMLVIQSGLKAGLLSVMLNYVHIVPPGFRATSLCWCDQHSSLKQWSSVLRRLIVWRKEGGVSDSRS